MVRRWRVIALGLVGGLVLAFPSAGSALPALAPIELTPGGPVPSTLTLVDGVTAFPVWQNSDTVAHTVTFADGLCSIRVAPGATLGCPIAWAVGRYAYTVDGSIPASLTYLPDPRTVTLTASPFTHTIRRGTHLRIEGLLSYGIGSPPPPTDSFTDMPVTVLARHDRHHRFRQIADAATGMLSARVGDTDGWPWWLDLHPTTTTTYIAVVNYQPEYGQVWQDAMSKPFRVVVRGRR